MRSSCGPADAAIGPFLAGSKSSANAASTGEKNIESKNQPSPERPRACARTPTKIEKATQTRRTNPIDEPQVRYLKSVPFPSAVYGRRLMRKSLAAIFCAASQFAPPESVSRGSLKVSQIQSLGTRAPVYMRNGKKNQRRKRSAHKPDRRNKGRAQPNAHTAIPRRLSLV